MNKTIYVYAKTCLHVGQENVSLKLRMNSCSSLACSTCPHAGIIINSLHREHVSKI